MTRYLAGSKSFDFIIESIEEYTGIVVIAKKGDEIRQMIIIMMRSVVTIYPRSKNQTLFFVMNAVRILKMV